jgi:hypothetical protein
MIEEKNVTFVTTKLTEIMKILIQDRQDLI